MRYSFLWDFTPAELDERFRAEGVPDFHSEGRGETGRYVRVSGTVSGSAVCQGTPLGYYSGRGGAARRCYVSLSDGKGGVFVLVPGAADVFGMREKRFTFTGRVRPNPDWPSMLPPPPRQPPSNYYVIDAGAGRWAAPTIAGLVVGAMGVAVFAVALRHWLGRRREFDAAARAPAATT
jgi:hypothetical protein